MKRIVALCLAAACLISMVGCAGDTNMDEKKPNNSASAYVRTPLCKISSTGEIEQRFRLN